MKDRYRSKKTKYTGGFLDPVTYAIGKKGVVYTIRDGMTTTYDFIVVSPYVGELTAWDSITASGVKVLTLTGTKEKPIPEGRHLIRLRLHKGLTIQSSEDCSILVRSDPVV